ncbi:FKBP12-associated protein [Coemansia sp. Benny D115]|nr:FKBP12-associated protein [Coemansia sp. Benny D115]
MRVYSTNNTSPGHKTKSSAELYGDYHFRKSIERGRRVYSVRNMLTALGLGGVVASVYFYSLKAVKQEDFSDIPMPREPTEEEKAKFQKHHKPSRSHAPRGRGHGHISGYSRGGRGRNRGMHSNTNNNVSSDNAAEPVQADAETEQKHPKGRGKDRGRGVKAHRGGRGGRGVGGGRQFNGKLTAEGEADADESATDLCSSLGRQLARSAYECMICCDSVRPRHAIWQCDCCWAVFHLPCVQRWAKASQASEDQWRCPGCQHQRAAAPTHYLCFCGATRNPEHQQGVTPHACGRLCGRRRGPHCPHTCPLPCHPGPCPPCTALAPLQACYCGRVSIRPRCGAAYDPVAGAQSCGAVCGELLGCGLHKCEQPCHAGLCAPCTREITQHCRCGRAERTAFCGAPALYECGAVCDQLLGCGHHRCERTCHGPEDDASHATCALDPQVVVSCHCGAHTAANLGCERIVCTDPVPSCGGPCRKIRPDCGHACVATCHAGPCPPCQEKVQMSCRCGSSTVEVMCGSPALCTRVCSAKRSCGRHRCNEQCCTDDQHECDRVCGRLLACKTHRCPDFCHRGACRPCTATSDEPLVCGCGRTRIEAPVPCGAQLPICRHACTRTRACGHFSLATHECHPDSVPCPPCVVLATVTCMCGAGQVRAVPCHRAQTASCGRICGRLLACGGHKCERSCHRASQPCLPAGTSCRRTCGKPRRSCGHACPLPCHAPAVCDESQACQAEVTVECPCGRRVLPMQCGASGSHPQGPTLECDELCRMAERNRRVALALGFPERAAAPLDGLARIRYSEEVLRFARANLSTVRDLETRIATFIADEKSTPVLRFAPMRRQWRAFLHALAPVYGCTSRSMDREPMRSVCWDRGVSAAVPSMVLSQAVRYAQPPAVVCSDRVLDAGLEDCDFDDAGSHIFEVASASTAAATGFMSQPKSAPSPAAITGPQYVYLIISDLCHGLTVNELRAAIDRVLTSDAPAYTVRWVDEDQVEMYCCDTESATMRHEILGRWESLLRARLPYMGVAGIVRAVEKTVVEEEPPASQKQQPQQQSEPLQTAAVPPPLRLSTVARRLSSGIDADEEERGKNNINDDDDDVPENWELLNIADTPQ